MDDLEGRFAQLLPTKVPDAALRDLAKALLKVKGVETGTTGNPPQPPHSRR